MLKFLFGLFITVLAASPWVYVLLVGGLPGAGSEMERELEELRQELIVSKQMVSTKDERIAELENELSSARSKVEFLEENIAKAEGRMEDAIKDREVLNEHIK